MHFKGQKSYIYLLLVALFAATFSAASAQIVAEPLDGPIARCRCYSNEFIQLANFDPHFCLTQPVYYPSIFVPAKAGETLIEYEMTILVDDLATLYVPNGDGTDTLIVNYTVDAPKTRVTIQYLGPCRNIKVRVVNDSPRDRPFGGSGMSLLITREENGKMVSYGTGSKNILQACAPGRCSDLAAADVQPIYGTGIVNPPDDCFPAYTGEGRNNRTGCDVSKWTEIRAHDQLSISPLCEFVAVGRMGAHVINPVDGYVPNLQTYGVELHLPFCK